MISAEINAEKHPAVVMNNDCRRWEAKAEVAQPQSPQEEDAGFF